MKHSYEREARSLLHTLKKRGITVLAVDDGEERVLTTDAPAIDTILSVDECWVRVKTKDGSHRTIYILLGNGPGEIVCDYGVHPELEAALREHGDRWDPA